MIMSIGHTIQDHSPLIAIHTMRGIIPISFIQILMMTVYTQNILIKTQMLLGTIMKHGEITMVFCSYQNYLTTQTTLTQGLPSVTLIHGGQTILKTLMILETPPRPEKSALNLM